MQSLKYDVHIVLRVILLIVQEGQICRLPLNTPGNSVGVNIKKTLFRRESFSHF